MMNCREPKNFLALILNKGRYEKYVLVRADHG